MALGRKTGGRSAGTKNRDKQAVIEQLAKLKVDPIEGLARIAARAEADGDLTVATRCYTELSQYCHPKLKALEVSSDPNSESIAFNINVGSRLPLSESLKLIENAAAQPEQSRPVPTDERGPAGPPNR